MNEEKLIQILNKYKNDTCTLEDVMENIKSMPFKDIDFAKIDTHRAIRQGYAEAVYCPGKTPEQIIKIMFELKQTTSVVLATRANNKTAKLIQKEIKKARYDKEAKMIILGEFPEHVSNNYALVITAGTVDIPIAKEAIITLKSNGIKTESIFDCGIAGAHRLFEHIKIIQKAKAIIAVAGMEGALASLIGGISPCPVIAVPTSKGYGANFEGLAPLLSMLNSCTSCVSVVNIDNGYGAGIIASLIVRQSK